MGPVPFGWKHHHVHEMLEVGSPYSLKHPYVARVEARVLGNDHPAEYGPNFPRVLPFGNKQSVNAAPVTALQLADSLLCYIAYCISKRRSHASQSQSPAFPHLVRDLEEDLAVLEVAVVISHTHDHRRLRHRDPCLAPQVPQQLIAEGP